MMKSILKRRPSPAMIVAIVALSVALGGTAIAANMIRSDDIVDGQVMTRDLHAGAVTPAKISRIPAVGLVRNSNFPVNPNTPVLVTFDAENYDTADMHNGSGYLVKARDRAEPNGQAVPQRHALHGDLPGLGQRLHARRVRDPRLPRRYLGRAHFLNSARHEAR
jgi:hypothetical protein